MQNQNIHSYPTKIIVKQDITENLVDYSKIETVTKNLFEQPLTLKLEIPYERYDIKDVINAVEVACQKLIKSIRCFE